MTGVERLGTVSDREAAHLWSAEVMDDLGQRIMRQPIGRDRLTTGPRRRWLVVIAVWAVLAATFGIAAPAAQSLSGQLAHRPGAFNETVPRAAAERRPEGMVPTPSQSKRRRGRRERSSSSC